MNVLINGVEYVPRPSINWDDSTLGDLVRSTRESLKMTLFEAAEKVDCAVSTLSNLEHDRVPNISFHVMIKVAAVYGIPLDVLALPIIKRGS